MRAAEGGHNGSRTDGAEIRAHRERAVNPSAQPNEPWNASNTLGDLLTLWGRRLGWSQRDWAQRSGLAERTIRDYLNDRKESLDLNSVVKLVRAVEAATGASVLHAAMELAEAHTLAVADRTRQRQLLHLRELEAKAELDRRRRREPDAQA